MTDTRQQPGDEIDIEMEPTLPGSAGETELDLQRWFGQLNSPGEEISSQLIQSRVLSEVYGTKHETTIGQYVLERRIGRGGMGEVYAGRDTLSNLEVAIKLLHREDDAEREREALLHEARSLAQVNSPNVVRLFYVGQHEDRQFIVMERIHGVTLQRWQSSRGRSLAEILEVYAQAARGLADAHRVGVIHHDFKPSNVLVAEDGRVLVTDFGLASRAREPRAGSELSLIEAATIQGVGTLRYMSPERVLCRDTDASSDQFSFFLAFFEAVHGAPALPISSVTERVDALKGCDVELPPRSRRVSRRLNAALERGLSRDPSERFASMDEVVAELDELRGSRRRKWVAGFGGFAAAAAASAMLLWPSPEPSSEPPYDPLAEVWPEGRRELLAAHPSLPGAALATQIDDYLRDWRQVYADGEGEPAVRRCLMGLRERVDTLVDHLVEDELEGGPERGPSEQAFEAVASLPRPYVCLGASLERPGEVEERELQRIEATIERGQIAEISGDFEAARGYAEQALEGAEALRWVGAQIDALELLGQVEAGEGRQGRALERFLEARSLSFGARANHRAGELSLNLALAANRQTPSCERVQALTLAEELTDDDPRLDLKIALGRARELGFEGQHAAAEELLDAALARYERAGLREPYLELELLRRRADAISAQGRDRREDGERAYREAVARSVEVLGEGHEAKLSAATLWSNAGVDAFQRRDYEQARAYFLEGKGLREEVLEAGHPLIAASEVHLAWVELASRDYDDALARGRRAARFFEAPGVDSDLHHEAYEVIGRALEGLGRWQQAHEALDEAARLLPPGKSRPSLLIERANVLMNLERDAEALALLDESLPEFEREAQRRGDHNALVIGWGLWLELLRREQPERVDKNLERILESDHLQDEHRERLTAAARGE